MKNLEELLNKFNWNKKAVTSYLLLEKNIPWIIEFLKWNYNDNSLIEFIITEILKEDEDIFYKIDNELELTTYKENLILKISLATWINLFSYTDSDNKYIVNKIINNGFDLSDVFSEIKSDESLEYLINNLLFKDKNISNILEKYDDITQNRKEILDKFFLKNTTKEIIKALPINEILKSIRNKKDICYKWENKQLKDMQLIFDKVRSNNVKNEIPEDNFSFQFLDIDNPYIQSNFLIITDNLNKNIFINLINLNDNITSKVFENAWIWNKKKNNFLDNLTKKVNKKISEIDDNYKVILNSYIFKKWKSNKENNVFDINWKGEENCILLVFKDLSADELQSFFDDFANYKHYEDEKENDK